MILNLPPPRPRPRSLESLVVSVGLVFVSAPAFTANAQQKSENDVHREASIAEFTRKTKDASYPALFDQAAKEFNVPSDILKGIAFAETRWEHLTWPPGETASPETGMPRPFGIMSLWDNQYFGHSLTEAAALLGKDSEDLKREPLQNIRGAAALLRKIYDATPRPDNSTEAAIESWRFAIRKYCGIPEPDLNARHALDVYVFMNQGYNKYGIEWAAHPVNLEPLREETRQIVAAEQARRIAISASNSNAAASQVPELSPADNPTQKQRMYPLPQSPSGVSSNVVSDQGLKEEKKRRWRIIAGALAVILLVVGRALWERRRRKRLDTEH